ncbi:MAG: hypothetical protein M3Y54_09625 [Bacteroidota bacterium]|nr:hypothetical protein [Bacteroidota bacterium]
MPNQVFGKSDLFLKIDKLPWAQPGIFNKTQAHTFFIFYSFTQMSDTPQLPEQGNTRSSAISTTGKSQGAKKPKPVKSGYAKTSVRLLIDHDHALRLASVLLERMGEPIHTIQAMVDEAMSRYMDFLQIKKGIDFQGIVPKKTPPTK